MDEIKVWITGVILSCFIGVIVMFFSPDSSVTVALKTTTALFVVFSFISPIFGDDLSFAIEDDFWQENINSEILSEEINSQMLMTTEFEVKQRLADFLNEMNIVFTNISVTADIDESNSIFIKEITVTLKSESKDKEEIVKEKIREIYNMDGEVLWE